MCLRLKIFMRLFSKLFTGFIFFSRGKGQVSAGLMGLLPKVALAGYAALYQSSPLPFTNDYSLSAVKFFPF